MAEDKDIMRQDAPWMNPMDDSILEYLRDVAASGPADIAKNLNANKKYVNQRLLKLHDYGMVDKRGRGVYISNEIGEGYLNEELDASELERRSE